MRVRESLLRIGAVLTLMLAAPMAKAEHAQPTLKDAERCLMDVLQKAPDVADPKFEVQRDGPWVHRFVEYVHTNRKGKKSTIRIAVEVRHVSGHDSYTLHADLNGLTTPGKMPEDWGIGDIARTWKSQCGVSTDILYN